MERTLGRILKIAGLGIVFWSLSLVWPEVNLILTPPLMTSLAALVAGLTLGLGLAGFWYTRHKQLSPDYLCLEGAGQKKINRDRHPSRPMHIKPV